MSAIDEDELSARLDRVVELVAALFPRSEFAFGFVVGKNIPGERGRMRVAGFANVEKKWFDYMVNCHFSEPDDPE